MNRSSGRRRAVVGPICGVHRLAALLIAILLAAAPGIKAAAAPGGQPAIGPVNGCQYRPPFITRLGLPDDARTSTATPGIVGFNILTRDPESDRVRPLLHDTWKSAGNLGQFTTDAAGNIYLVPVPLVSLELNPLAEQNKVQVIDGKTGRMREFIDLPAPRPIAADNPFGTIGLAYDCETNSLYVASLAGSSATEELGTVFQIDLARKAVASRLDGIDVLGLGVFNGASGKRLYLGSARRPEVLSVALDASGAITGEPRHELDLAALDLAATNRAQKIRFDRDRRMLLKAVPFAYSLRVIGPDETALRVLRYDPARDRWVLDQVGPAAEGSIRD